MTPEEEDFLVSITNIVGLAERVLRQDDPRKTTPTVDPWRWHCRLCGAGGLSVDREERDAEATSHECTRLHPILGWAENGRLVHVWSFTQEDA